jgi:hypothetical protein
MSLESEVLLGVDLANFQSVVKNCVHGIDDLMRDWEVKRAEFEESVRSKQAQAKQLKLRLACEICGEKAKLNCPCGTTAYCSTDCQRIDWRDRGHRTACKKIRDERAAETARAEAPTPPPEEVFYGPAPRSHADEVRARIAAEHEAARARREANPEPEPLSARFGSQCPICLEEWDVNDTGLLRICCCRKVCQSCEDKIGFGACPLCRLPCATDTENLARLRRHVENEVPEAISFLGSAYRYGYFGLMKSDKKAAKIWKRAVELGDVEAMRLLGKLYVDGSGVKTDKKTATATALFRIAADRGDAIARFELGMIADEEIMGSGFHDFQLAADQGHSLAQSALGAAYEWGQGVGRDIKESRRWYALAAAKGDECAIERLSGPDEQYGSLP